MQTVTFSPELLRVAARSYSSYKNRLIVRVINGKARVYVWLTGDEYFRRALSHNVAKQS